MKFSSKLIVEQLLVQFQCAMPTGNKSMASQAKPWPRCITMQQSRNCQFHSVAARFAIVLSQHQVAKYLRILRHQPNHAKKNCGNGPDISNHELQNQTVHVQNNQSSNQNLGFTMTINSESPCRCWLVNHSQRPGGSNQKLSNKSPSQYLVHVHFCFQHGAGLKNCTCMPDSTTQTTHANLWPRHVKSQTNN